MKYENRAYSELKIKNVNEKRRIIRGIATTPKMDRKSTTILSEGILFKNPIPLLWQHDPDKPIGIATFSNPTKDGIQFQAEIPIVKEEGVIKSRVDEAWQSIKLGLTSTVSIGLKPIKIIPQKNGTLSIAESEALELSVVTIPANPDAMITDVTRNKAADYTSALDINPPISSTANSKKRQMNPSGASANLTRNNILIQRNTNMTNRIGDRISALETVLMQKLGQMEEIMNRSAEAERTTDVTEQEEFDSLNEELRAVDADISRLRSIESIQATAAVGIATKDTGFGSVPVKRMASAAAPVRIRRQEEKGIRFAQVVRCMIQGKNNPHLASMTASDIYDGAEFLPELQAIIRSVNSTATTTDPEWAGELVDYKSVANEFVEFMRPATIVGKFGQNGIPSLREVPFRMKVSRQTEGTKAQWVGEGKPKPLTKGKFGSITLDMAKVAAIVTMTDELIKQSSPKADLVIRDDLVKAIGERLDRDFVDPDKAENKGLSPGSITNGLTPIPSTGTPSKDINLLFKVLIQNEISPAKAVLILPSILALQLAGRQNPLGQNEYPNITMGGGMINGIPVIASQSVPDGLVILAAADEIFLADEGRVDIDASEQATVVDEEGNISSLWQENLLGIRAERFINWAKRKPNAVSFIEGADYEDFPGS